MEYKIVRASNQGNALINFRRLTPDKFVAVKATRIKSGEYEGRYKVYYRLRKGEY